MVVRLVVVFVIREVLKNLFLFRTHGRRLLVSEYMHILLLLLLLLLASSPTAKVPGDYWHV